MNYFPVLLTLAGTLTLATATAQQANTAPIAAQQEVTKYNVTGKVVESTTQNGLEMGNVVLQPIGGTQQYFANTDDKGQFTIEAVPEGNYKLSVFFIGFKKQEKEVSITAANHSLGTIVLQADATVLKEVTVGEFRKLVEQRPDGITYNAENDKSNLGSSATDLLRKVPMVTVDMDGNVQLRGNSNIKVQIDGKPSEMIASSVKDVLRQIPADNIKSIEVITSPGAKYEGEGASGIINIVTKKKAIQGLSGSIFAGPSYNIDANLLNGHIGGSLTYRKGKFGTSFNAGVSRWSMKLLSDAVRTDFPGTANETKLSQNQDMFGRGNFVWSRLSADYQIDSLQSIQGGINYNPGTWLQDMDMTATYPKTGMNYFRSTQQRNPRQNVGFNAAYSKKFKSNPKRTLDILAGYSIGNRNSDYDLYSKDLNTNTVNYKEQNQNITKNNELTAQIDYVEPLKAKNQKLEFGVKAINRYISSDYVLENWNLGQNGFTVDANRSNMLTYNQLVGAAYGQFTTPLSKMVSMIAGARYEMTRINGNVRDNGGNFELPLFHNFLPNIAFMFDLKNFNKLKLSYNKRIERPSISYINPFIDYSDPMNLKEGNSKLVPERTHNFELGYSTFVGRTSVNLTAFTRYTDNAIEMTTTVKPNGVSMGTYNNEATRSATGLDAFASTTLFGKLMINVNGSAYYKVLTSKALNIKNSGVQYNGNIFANYALNDVYKINGFAMYNGNQVQLQGTQGGWYYYSLGVERSIFKGKGTLGLSLENFLTPKVKIPTNYKYQNANYDVMTNYIGRGIRLSFNYNFGKMQFAKEKSIKNDDLKKEEGGQMGGGQGGGR